MQINQDQFDAMEPNGQDFEQAVIEFVRAELPQHYKNIPEEDGDAMVCVGIRRARSWGFERLSDVMQFVALMVEVSPNFDEQPDLRAVLEQSPFRDTATIQALLAEPLAPAWEQAALNADPEAWTDSEWLNADPEDTEDRA